MNLKALATNIKALDPTAPPATSTAERDYFRYYGIDFEERYPDVNHHFGHFPSGRFDIVAHYFENKHAVETCFLVHGYYDHSGLYGHLIEYCLKRNFSVVIYDLPGHGLSTGEKASVENFDEYQSVFKDVLAVFSEQAPAPWYAIGQSTGAAILMDFMLSGDEKTFVKTVLLAPLVRPDNWVTVSITHSIGQFFLKRVKRHFAVNSHDQAFLEFLKNKDPLQSEYLPLQWIGALKQWINYFSDLSPIDYVPLIIQGRQDETVDWQYNLPVVQNKFPGAKVFYLRSGRHQLANESREIRMTMFSAIDIYFDLYGVEVDSTEFSDLY